MDRHFHLLVAHQGERFACLTFRKVANWYCRVLRPGREMQQRLMRLERSADFDAMVDQMRDMGPPPQWQAGVMPEIAVPQGPNERW
jgi:tRNA-dihydrouridine synthase